MPSLLGRVMWLIRYMRSAFSVGWLGWDSATTQLFDGRLTFVALLQFADLAALFTQVVERCTG